MSLPAVVVSDFRSPRSRLPPQLLLSKLSTEAAVAQVAPPENRLPRAMSVPEPASSWRQMPAPWLALLPRSAWKTLPPGFAVVPRLMLAIELFRVTPTSDVATTMPLPALPRLDELVTLTFEPPSMRMPLPLVVPVTSRPFTVLSGRLAPGVWLMARPATLFWRHSIVPAPAACVPWMFTEPVPATRMPCWPFLLNAVVACPFVTVMFTCALPVTCKPGKFGLPTPLLSTLTPCPIERTPALDTRTPSCWKFWIVTLRRMVPSVVPVLTWTPMNALCVLPSRIIVPPPSVPSTPDAAPTNENAPELAGGTIVTRPVLAVMITLLGTTIGNTSLIPFVLAA